MANKSLGQTVSAQEQSCPISEPTSPPDGYITNFSDVDFHSNQIDEPEGSILYKMELSNNISFNEVFFFSPWMTVPLYTYYFEEDGQYYWQVLTKFNHDPEPLVSVSEPYFLTLDTTPPSVPKIIPEHAIIFENSLTITWLPSTDELCESILYYIEMSESVEFSDITDSAGWQVETFSTFNGLENQNEYYFRLKAIDCAGNESELSDIISLTYTTVPIETAPIDNSPPTPPIIFTPVNNSLSNQTNIKITARAEPNTINYIYINGQQKQNVKFMSEIETTVSGIEGKNTIEVISKKKSGTQSSSIVEFFIDTIPPDTPIIELEPDVNNQTLYISVVGETSTNITVFANGKQAESKTMEYSPKKLPVVLGWEAGKNYSISATLSDKAGNTSAPSSSMSWTAPIEQQNIITPEPEIGIGSGSNEPIPIPDPPSIPTCNITIHENKLNYQIKTCTIPAPILAHISNKGDFGSNVFWFDTLGSTQTRMNVHFEHIRCKPKSFWDPRTWLFCIDEHYKNTEKEIRMRNKLIPKIDGMSQRPAVYRQSINNHGQFTLENYSFEPVENKSLSVKNIQQGYVKASEMWVDIHVSSWYSNSLTIPQNNNADSTGKYFSFMFDHYIGVTQWHGYTAYQSPHKGIDFGAVKNSIVSPSDGYIRSIGWDSYYGDCLSGGNYVRIEHDNGMHSVYMHLENYTKTNGQTWSNGERIARGQQVGISGNTGAWNCQPLGHHLHFELRKDSSQSSHVDPVPYINVDWNQIPTLGWTQYPGRLTGDNPHPNF